MKQHLWKDQGSCRDRVDRNLFFDIYEEQPETRKDIDNLCRSCPVSKTCFAVGVSSKEWGVWGGIYLVNGEISREFNNHKSKQDWADTWTSLTME